ncbi:hypothetical protein EV690_1952 [Celerinatantimonas diazotrophica]|uniref:Endonuclease/exonuclease/phosphatase domain-containing protein n=2 Tax=Celerinatantimonas diazotrophica TaxID=412034 RepID=A0A4V2PPP9_9GAMM|nr:hypothetical protein EV690_1952 [Celerinatantimonas diazotrophica]CAG9296436.1 hypothetical protein CEDIAZO_01587 [Celerinatantimonas diazotrophica]
MGPKRDNKDYHQLYRYIRQAHIDVLAFAEVGSIQAIQHVVGKDYTIEISHRATREPSEGKWRQYTGFAIRKDLVYKRFSDLNLNVNYNNRLRNAVDVELKSGPGKSLRLLAIHLRSGCFTQSQSSSFACQTLARQAKRLHQWIARRNQQHQRFVILGDFNRRMLNTHSQWFYHLLQGGDSHRKNHLILINHGASHCWHKKVGKHHKIWMNEHKQFIDFILMNQLAATAYIENSFQEIAPSRSEARHFNLSDHCLIIAKLKQ